MRPVSAGDYTPKKRLVVLALAETGKRTRAAAVK
jgi:hypothetical protein